MTIHTPVDIALPGSLTFPADGETIEAADVTLPIAAVANGVLHESVVRSAEIAALDLRLTPLSNLAALTALAAPTDGMMRFVRGRGTFVFTSASVLTAYSGLVLAADDSTPGRWLASAVYPTTVQRSVLPATAHGYTGLVSVASRDQNVAMQVYDATMKPQTRYGELRANNINTASSASYGHVVDVTRALVHGATLTLAEAYYFPDSGGPFHAGAPAVMPGFGVFAKSASGHISMLKLITGTGSVLDATTAPNIDNGRLINFVPTQNQIVDLQNYSYFAILWDEGHTNALSCWWAGLRFTQTLLDARGNL